MMTDPVAVRSGIDPIPLFVVHDDASGSAYVRELADQCANSVAIHVLSRNSVAAARLTTLEGIATVMTRVIRTIQPSGPYRLAGLSWGGALAYEVATQLLGQDQGVAFLGIVGTRHVDGVDAAACDGALAEDVRRYWAQPLTVSVQLLVNDATAVAGRALEWTTAVPRGRVRVITVPGEPSGRSTREDARRIGLALVSAMRGAGNDGKAQLRTGLRLVPLQSRPDRAPPCICIPGAGADVTSFIDIVSCLGETRPVYGLQPRGLDGLLVPHSTVQAAALTYIEAIDAAHLQGPPYLVGHSFGGWVAFEIACRLSELGRSVGGVTMLDSEPPDVDDNVCREYSDADCLREWLDAVEQRLGRPLGIDNADLEARTGPQRQELLHRQMVKGGILPPQSDPGVLQGRLRTFFANLRTHYCPQRQYAGPITLVVADAADLDADGNRRRLRDAADGWRRWAPNLECVKAPGNHMTMLAQPHAGFLASMIRTAHHDEECAP